nr:MAG TPA: hypothetical protein [Bacteriophage sp.]
MGAPPLSTASDTRHSSPRTPHQCRTLARVQAPRTPRPQCSSAGDVTQLHIKGVLTLSFPQERILTPTLREAILVNKATTHATTIVITALMGVRTVGAVRLPTFWAFLAVLFCGYAMAILSCCCLVISVVRHPV